MRADRAVYGAERYPHLAVRVSLRVAQEVPQHPCQLPPGADDLGVDEPLGPRHHSAPAALGELLVDEYGGREALPLRPLPRVETCQQQEVGRELLEPYGVTDRTRHVQQPRMGLGDLQLRPQRGDRAAPGAPRAR